MRILGYQIGPHHIDVHTKNDSLRIYLVEKSGHVYKRRLHYPLLDAFFYHKGILLGVDAFKTPIFAHNTERDGGASVVHELYFADGSPIYEDQRYVTNDYKLVTVKSLDFCVEHQKFNVLTNNCITFINRCYSRHYSIPQQPLTKKTHARHFIKTSRRTRG